MRNKFIKIKKELIKHYSEALENIGVNEYEKKSSPNITINLEYAKRRFFHNCYVRECQKNLEMLTNADNGRKLKKVIKQIKFQDTCRHLPF